MNYRKLKKDINKRLEKNENKRILMSMKRRNNMRLNHLALVPYKHLTMKTKISKKSARVMLPISLCLQKTKSVKLIQQTWKKIILISLHFKCKYLNHVTKAFLSYLKRTRFLMNSKLRVKLFMLSARIHDFTFYSFL